MLFFQSFLIRDAIAIEVFAKFLTSKSIVCDSQIQFITIPERMLMPLADGKTQNELLAWFSI
jgi:hypothetical protein